MQDTHWFGKNKGVHKTWTLRSRISESSLGDRYLNSPNIKHTVIINVITKDL